MSPRTWTLATLALLLGAGLAAAQAEPLSVPLSGHPLGAPEETSAHAGNGTGNHTNHTLPPPEVTPDNQSVTGPYGSALPFAVDVKNVAGETQQIAYFADAPIGWTVRLSANNTTLAPGQTVALSGSVSALSPLPATGVVTLHVRGRDAESIATVHACFSSVAYGCPPPPGGNGTGGNGTHGGNGTGGNGTQGGNGTSPPPNGTQPPSNQTQPPQNETQPPANDTQEAPATRAAPASRPGTEIRGEGSARARHVRTAWTGQGSVPSI